MTGLIGAKLLVALSASGVLPLVAGSSPSPSPGISGARQGPFIPQEGVPNSDGAGLDAFLILVGLILASAGLFFAMNRSLKRARRNLGGDVLPRRRNTGPPVGPARDDPPPVTPPVTPPSG